MGEGRRYVRGRQHRSCGKRTSFPATMHMLSTAFPHRKCRQALFLASFPLFPADIQSVFRFFFSLSTALRGSYSWVSLQEINRPSRRLCPRHQTQSDRELKARLSWIECRNPLCVPTAPFEAASTRQPIRRSRSTMERRLRSRKPSRKRLHPENPLLRVRVNCALRTAKKLNQGVYLEPCGPKRSFSA